MCKNNPTEGACELCFGLAIGNVIDLLRLVLQGTSMEVKFIFL